MAVPSSDTTRLLDLLRTGDLQARSRLIKHACKRLRLLARRMLKTYPGVRRWEETDDVLNNALFRLYRALADVVPESSAHFYHLAAVQIRRELLDLARHYHGPLGHAKKHHTDPAGKAPDDPGGPLQVQPDSTGAPTSLEEWTLFHERVASLPDEEREVFGLVWYEGLTREQVADVLGVNRAGCVTACR